MPTIAWIALAYWVGTIPSPYLVARIGKRHDLIAEMRRQDSPGDAHFIVARKMSGALGGLAIVLDILKGFIPALVARVGGEDPGTLAWIGVAAVAGHSYPPYFRRSGGRGLTTAAGVSLVIVPKAMVGSGVIALAGTIGKLGGFGTSVGFALLPVFAVVFGYEATLVLMTVGIVGLIMIRRLEGIEEDRREGVPIPRAILGRWLFDLPRGKRDL
ncbi:MAG: glycerol-3-phosphate acyltransferase [Actinomycetota bacterium]